MAKNIALWFAKMQFNSTRSEFYQDLAEALDDNGVLVEEIKTLESRAINRGDLTAPIYSLWLRRMDDRSFARALLGTVPDMDVMILEAAEMSNNLTNGLRFLARTINAIAVMRQELKKAIGGPLFLMGFFTAMLLGFSFYVVPILTQIMKPETWPMTGQMLYAVASFVTKYGYWLAATIIIIATAYIRSLPRWDGKLRTKFDRYMPLYSLYRDYIGAVFLVSLATLLESGVGLSEALGMLNKRASPWLRWHIQHIQMRLDTYAANPALAFDTGVFNQALTDRVASYGARSEFHVAIGKVGISSVEKVTAFVSATATLLNRLLVLLCGSFLVFMILGVMLTAQEAQNAIQKQAFIK